MAQVVCLLFNSTIPHPKPSHPKPTSASLFCFQETGATLADHGRHRRTHEDPNVPNEIPPFAYAEHKTYNYRYPPQFWAFLDRHWETKQDAGSRLISFSFLAAGDGEELAHCFIRLLLSGFEFVAALLIFCSLLTYYSHHYLPTTYYLSLSIVTSLSHQICPPQRSQHFTTLTSLLEHSEMAEQRGRTID
jgi:hypothetical protein